MEELNSFNIAASMVMHPRNVKNGNDRYRFFSYICGTFLREQERGDLLIDTF